MALFCDPLATPSDFIHPGIITSRHLREMVSTIMKRPYKESRFGGLATLKGLPS
jgi:hypothetical protein